MALGRVWEDWQRWQKEVQQATTLNLMAAAMSNAKTQTVIAPLALGFFGCMRPEEITSERPKEKGLPAEQWFGWKAWVARLCFIAFTVNGPHIAKAAPVDLSIPSEADKDTPASFTWMTWPA